MNKKHIIKILRDRGIKIYELNYATISIICVTRGPNSYTMKAKVGNLFCLFYFNDNISYEFIVLYTSTGTFIK